MSFWGEALSYKQGMWETEQYESGKQVLAALAELGEVETTEKELLLLAAVKIIFDNGTAEERNLAFAQEMKKV